jgi:hypothetical protein
MEAPETNIRRMIQELNQYILPSTLMESFDAYREEAYKEAIRSIAPSTLAWFLDMLNRYRGHEDRKESLLEVFDSQHVHCEPPSLGDAARDDNRSAPTHFGDRCLSGKGFGNC